MITGMCHAIVGRSGATVIVEDETVETPATNAGAALAGFGGTDAGGKSLESDMECSKEA